MRYPALVLALALAACHGTIDLNPNNPDIDAKIYLDAYQPPLPAGCITDVSTGDHTFTCGGLQVDARIPAACQYPGCGLILVVHGDTGTGLLMDAHVKMRELGDQNGYIVIAPTGPPWPNGGCTPPYCGSTWYPTNDATLVDMVTQFRDVFHVDPKKIHVTGFSRGGFMTWRLLCDHADLFASAAPAGAGDASQNGGEPTCFNNNRKPSRHIPILFMMGQYDTAVGITTMVTIRDNAIASYGATGPQVVDQDPTYEHDRWTSSDGAVIETFFHKYKTVSNGPFASAQGHCIAGSQTDPYAPQYAIPCVLPSSFVWGQQVMTFFSAHPMP